jgi:putative SOS response-associated peptidase YedK
MCGRFTLQSANKIRLRKFRPPELSFEPRYNIAPSQDVLVIADFGNGPEARMLSWGLIPSWSSDGRGFINARSETLEEKRSFSESFRFRRCLIPADGFFEWKRRGKERRPYYIQSVHEGPMMFAGVWDTWRGRGGAITSCAIITTPANDLIGELHDRMPAILVPEFQDAWLDPRTSRTELLQMLTPFSSAEMKMHPVSNRVNSVNNDSPELVDPVETEVGETLSLFQL